jgi:hypothetical protein
MDIKDFKEWAEIVAYLVTIGGVPGAVALFYLQKRKEREEREERAFDELDDKYVEFMALCLQHRNVDVLDPPLPDDYEPDADQRRIEHALFAILISLFERAHVMYNDLYETSQWQVWILFMKSYCNRKSFLRVWKAIGNQFDPKFQDLLNKKLISATSGTRGSQAM